MQAPPFPSLPFGDRRFVFISRARLTLGGGRFIERGEVIDPERDGFTFDHLMALQGSRRVWKLDAEAIAFAFAASEPDRQDEDRAVPDQSTREAEVSGSAEPEALHTPHTPNARAWLLANLAQGARLASEIYADGAAAGFSKRTIERASAELEVESYQHERAWWKRLKGQTATHEPDASTRARANGTGGADEVRPPCRVGATEGDR